MKSIINSKGLWWIPGREKLFGSLTFDENKGGLLSVNGRFPDMSPVEKDRFNYPIILGESDDGETFTLRNCSLRKTYPYMKISTKSEVNVDTIIIGHQFQTVQSIQFEKFSVVLSNIDRVISPVAKPVSFHKKALILELPIKDTCVIRFFAETSVLKNTTFPRTTMKVDTDIEIISTKEKTFEKYQEIYNKILDFFNFFIRDEVDFVSLRGTYKEVTRGSDDFANSKEVTILYRYPQLVELNKPVNNINFYIENKYCLWIPQLLSRWFQIHLTNRFESVFNLYFAVMLGSSDLFMEFQFLALAQALEVYHCLTIGNASVYRIARIPEAEKIRKIISEHLAEKSNWVEEMLSSSVRPSLRERLMELFEKYHDFCYTYLKFNKKEELVQRIKDNRDYFTHWGTRLKKKSVTDDDLYWLMKDTQFILRLCLLSELGFDMNGLRLIFCVDEMMKIRNIREKQNAPKA
jgi:hypothetical protein